MEYDGTASPQSVRQALRDLELKARLLEEEREYYVNLAHTSAISFARHREDLASLVAKEQLAQRAEEDRLRSLLSRLLSENEALAKEWSETRESSAKRIQMALAEFRAESEARCERHRREGGQQSEQTMSLRRLCEERRKICEALVGEIDSEKRQQVVLQEEVDRLSALNHRLLCSERTVAPQVVAKPRKPRAKIAKPFVPSGSTDQNNRLPATHNVMAMVQTIAKQNFADPHTNSPSRSRRELDSLSRSVMREILELRGEYDSLCRSLTGSGSLTSDDVTARLRQVFSALDAKKEQLRHLRNEQTRLDGEHRLHTVMMEVAEENGYCSSKLAELLGVLRSSSDE